MRKKPKQPTALIFGGIAGIAILAGIGFIIAFAISRARDVTPTTTEASSCCTCNWHLEIGSTQVRLGSVSGKTVEEQCHIAPRFPGVGDSISYIGDYVPIACSDIPVEDIFESIPYGLEEGDVAVSDEFHRTEGQCQGGCIVNTSMPLTPPDRITQSNNDVTFYTIFELRYATAPTQDISEAEMVIEYPDGADSPDPVPSSDIELITTYNENDNDSFPVSLYKVTFDTTWDTVIDYNNKHETYTLTFSAKSSTGTEVPNTDCSRELTVPEVDVAGDYCRSLDFAPVSGRGTLDVTLSVDAGAPSDDLSYVWNLDLNCNGQIDGGTGEDAEEFTTPSDTTTITRTFTYPEGGLDTKSCDVSVEAQADGGSRTLQELTPGSCEGVVSLSQVLETCGNGTCDPGEFCDPNGNLVCPAETPLPTGTTCTEECAYCGDGEINGQEECDPGIAEGDTGYEADCGDNCIIGTDLPGTGEDGDTGDSDADQDLGSAEALSVTQETPECLEMVSPNNTTPITITVTNGSSSSIAIRAVSDTLPKGISYQTASSIINSTANTADTGVTVETAGESQLITWDNDDSGWTIEAGETLTITFTAVVSQSAVMGAQTNRVTVTPSDANPITSQSPILIAQTCTQPLTGLFDRNIGIILIGSIFLLIAGAAFYTGIGTQHVALLLDRGASTAKKGASALKDLNLRLSQPQKYMERKIERSALKKIKDHADDKKTSKKRNGR